MSNIAIFASGEGSNAEKIVKYFQGKNGATQVVLIVSNKEKSGVRKVAESVNVDFRYFSNEEFISPKDLLTYLADRSVAWIVLAGFLRKIPSELIQLFPNRIINIHPALLPKYGGKGMYGDYVHAAVLENGEMETGISIHFVNEKFDEGEMIFQKEVEVSSGDGVKEIKEKVRSLEHQYYPLIIDEIVSK